MVDVADLEKRLQEAEETLRAIRNGEADALVVAGRDGDQIFTLKGAEQPYRVLVETMNDGAITLLPDGTIAYSNRCFAQMIQTPLEQVIGTAFDTFVAPDQHGLLASLLARASMGALQGDLTILASAGVRVPAQLALSPLQIDDTQGTCLIVRDITEQKQADETIRLQAAQHATMLATSSDGFWVFDLQGKLLNVNDAYCRLSGYSRQELLNLHVSDIEAMETPQDIVRHIQKVTLSGFDRYESSQRKKNGDVMDVEISISYSQPNEQMLVFVRDITERKRAGEEIHRLNEDLEHRVRLRTAELEAATAEMRAAQHIGHLGSWELFLTFREEVVRNGLHWSDECFRVFGYEPDEVEVTDKLFFERVHPEDREAVAAALERTIRERVPYSLEHRLTLRDGSQRVVREEGDIVCDPAGRPCGLLGTVQDITERKLIEAQLAVQLQATQQARSQAEAAVRARDEFLSIAAHELKTPVTVVKLASQVLKAGRAQPWQDKVRLDRTFETLEIGTARLARLTDDLFDVARLQNGHLRVRLQNVDVSEMAKRLEAPYRMRLSPGQRLDIRESQSPCLVMADPDRLQQVLSNLLDNAFKYSPEGGTIRVLVQPEVDGCVIHIEDEGIGLPTGSEENIFKPFGRASNALASELNGMGLGLYICRQIIESHGGRVWADSLGERQGTVMHVWLPASRSAPEASRLPATGHQVSVDSDLAGSLAAEWGR